MPYRKKRVYKRRRRYTKKVRPSRNLGPLAVKLKTKMIYHEEFNLDVGAAGVPVTYVFSANGLYDPNITGIGHQPRGFDQLVGTLYDHFVVIGAKLTWTAHNADTGNANQMVLSLRDNSVSPSSPNDIMEYRYIKRAMLSPEGSGPNVKTLTLICNPNKFLGRSKPLSDPDLKGSSLANPVEQAYFHCSVLPGPSGVDTGVIYNQVRIEYTAILIEPRMPPVS